MITKFIPVLLISSLLFTACNKKDETTKNSEQKSSRAAETKTVTETKKGVSNIINLKTTDDETIKLTATTNGILFDKYKGKVVLLDFFATWCPPCRAEIPHLVDIQKSLKDNVQIIGVLMEESKSNDDINEFISTYNMNFPITNSKENFMLSDALGGIKSLPTMVMYDSNGDYFTHYVGAAPQEMIETDIQKALEKTSKSSK